MGDDEIRGLLAELDRRGHGELHVAARDASSVGLWMGDCCERCAPASVVTFQQLEAAIGLEELEVKAPRLRLASDDECRAFGVARAPGVVVVAIVDAGASAPVHPSALIAARVITVEARAPQPR